MRVLQINSVCTGASTGTICVQLSGMVTARGGDCLIAYGRGLPAPSVESLRTEKRIGFLAHVLFSRLTDRQGFFPGAATKKLCGLIREYDPDIVHLHNLHGYYLNNEILFAELARTDKPIVMTLHDCWTFTGHCAYPLACGKWKTGCGKCPRIKSYPKAVIDQSRRNFKDKNRLFTLPQNVTVVTPSNWLAGLAKHSFLEKYPIKIIPNGIDLTVFRPTVSDFKAKNGIKEGEKIALGVANFHDPNKGFNDFTALPKLLPGCRIVLVGLSEKQISSLPEGMSGFCRIKNPSQLAEIYSAADVFVNPTYADNFPTVNLEALACGTPVITYETGGSAEALGGGCGMAVAAGDRKALAQAVKNCIIDPPTREKCRNRALLYDKNDRFEEYYRLYEQLIRGE